MAPEAVQSTQCDFLIKFGLLYHGVSLKEKETNHGIVEGKITVCKMEPCSRSIALGFQKEKKELMEEANNLDHCPLFLHPGDSFQNCHIGACAATTLPAEVIHQALSLIP